MNMRQSCRHKITTKEPYTWPHKLAKMYPSAAVALTVLKTLSIKDINLSTAFSQNSLKVLLRVSCTVSLCASCLAARCSVAVCGRLGSLSGRSSSTAACALRWAFLISEYNYFFVKQTSNIHLAQTVAAEMNAYP